MNEYTGLLNFLIKTSIGDFDFLIRERFVLNMESTKSTKNRGRRTRKCVKESRKNAKGGNFLLYYIYILVVHFVPNVPCVLHVPLKNNPPNFKKRE
jgi:hypothetical protein